MKQLVIGLGCGRCGTRSLATFLNLQPDANITHEGSRAWKWDGSSDVISPLEQILLRPDSFVGDVSSSYLKYVDRIIDFCPTVRFLALRRDRAGNIASWERFLVRRRLRKIFQAGNRAKRGWNEAFPHYPELPLLDAIARYYDEYNQLLDSMMLEFPTHMRLFPIDGLNDGAVLHEMLDHIRYPKVERVIKQVCVNKTRRRKPLFKNTRFL